MFEKNASPEFKKHALGIILVGCLAMYFSCCITTDAMNVLQPVFTEMGWSYSQLTMPLTLGGYILVGLSFVFSTIIIKNGTRVFGTMAFLAMTLGTVCIAAAYMSDNYVIYFIGGLLGKFGATAAQMFIFQLCAEWFNSTRGRILGIVTIAAPLDSASSTTLLTLGKAHLGFATTYFIMAGILLASTVLAYRFSHMRPSDLGMTPDGIEVKKSESVSAEAKSMMTMREILSCASTWKIIVAFGIFNGTISAIMSFFITRMTELKISNTFALFLLSFASLIGIPLSYLYGWLDDKFDTIKACVVLGIGFVLVCVCLLFGSADHLVLIILAAIGMGSMTGGCPNLHPSSIMTVFGADEYQNANRYIGIGISLISTFGTQLMSSCMDQSGDLNMGYMLFAGLCMIGTLCIATTKKVVTE